MAKQTLVCSCLIFLGVFLVYTEKAVTLSSSDAPFKGFFVKAFDENNKEIGQFEASSDTKAVTKCSGVTHTSNAPKTTVKAVWKAPEGATGKVHFRATVVIDYHKHVTGLQSTVA